MTITNRTRWLAASAAVLACAVAGPLAAGPALALDPCGDVDSAKPRAVAVEVKGKSCREALAVAEGWIKKTRSGDCDEYDCELKGWECHSKRPNEPSYRVKCVTEGGRLQWTVTRKRP